MTTVTAVLAIAGAMMVGIISPGPSFIVVARTAVAQSRRAGFLTSLGMGVGGVMYASVALVGLYGLLASVGWLYVGLKIAGGLYLVWLGLKIWRHAPEPLETETSPEPTRRGHNPFWRGLTTQLSNPKTAVVYGSVFAALLPQDPAPWAYAALPALVFTLETSWYSIVSACFATRRPRELYARAKRWIDRGAAGVIAALGIRLATTAARTGL